MENIAKDDYLALKLHTGGTVVKCLTGYLRVLGSSRIGSSGTFRGSVLGQDTSEPQPSTGETQERHE